MVQKDLSEYTKIFIDSAQEHIQNIKSQIEELDLKKTLSYEEIYRNAHSLKGSSSVMHAFDIESICTEIVKITDPKTDPYPVEIALPKIKIFYNDLANAFNNYKKVK